MRSEIFLLQQGLTKKIEAFPIYWAPNDHHHLKAGEPTLSKEIVQKNNEPEMCLLKKRVIDLEAKHKSSVEDVLAKLLSENLKMPQITSYCGEGDSLSHLNKYTSWMEQPELVTPSYAKLFQGQLLNSEQRL